MAKPSSKVGHKTTIQDVATSAGVSTGTVSRVLNGRNGVHIRTRQAVLEAIERLEYQPDIAARELSFRQSTRIGLNIKGIRRLTPFYMLFLEHLVTELQNDGYRLEEVPLDRNELPSILTDAMILFGVHDDDPRISYLQEKNVPFVLIGHQDGASWVAPDDRQGGYLATRHLIRLGHQDILHVTGAMAGQGEHDRYSGYQEALKEAGLSVRREYLLDGDFSTLGAYRAVRKACEASLNFSAIFAASDEMAIGTIAALEDLGLSVPTDVSVVGFDDLPDIGEKLTTIRQDIGQITNTAVRLLKAGLTGQPPQHEIIPVQLIVRGTTAKRRLVT